MDRWQAIGLGFAVASFAFGTIGLVRTEPLPLSAQLGVLGPLDANSDGRLSLTEWRSDDRSEDDFSALDANTNDYLEPDEARLADKPDAGN